MEFINAIYALLVFAGACIIAYTAYNWEKRMDSTTLRARAFLNESFLEDNWKLLLLVFFFSAIMQFNFEPLLEKSISEFMKGTAQLAVMTGIVISEYKWLRLMNPPEHRK